MLLKYVCELSFTLSICCYTRIRGSLIHLEDLKKKRTKKFQNIENKSKLNNFQISIEMKDQLGSFGT